MEQFTKSLSRFQRRAALLYVLSISFFFAATLVAAVLVVLWIDSIVPFSSALRWYVGRIGLIAGFVGLVIVGSKGLRSWNSKRVASLVDQSVETGGTITTGWELNDSLSQPAVSHPKNEQSASFAKHAIRTAHNQLGNIALEQVVSWRSLRTPIILLLCIVAFALSMTLVAPNYMWHQWRRIVYPQLDIPPYSDLMLYLEESELSIKYGDDIKILAVASKKPRERLELVTQTENGKEYVLPMLSRGATQWQAMLTDVHDSMDYYVRSGSARSERGKLTVQLTPEIKATRVRVTPPEYTKKATFEGPIPDNGITGLAGTNVELVVESNRELSAGTIQFRFSNKTESMLDMLPVSQTAENESRQLSGLASSASRSVRAMFSLTSDATFEARIRDVDNLLSTDSVQSKLRVIADAKPVVRIIEPKPLSLATPDIDLPVLIAAEDDYGISSLRLYRSLNGSPATAELIPTEGVARLDAKISLSLPLYGLKPGDEIELFARVEDNDPAGVKGFESTKTTIKIISVREFQDILLEQQGADALRAKYDAAQRYLEKMSAALAAAKEAAKKAEEAPNDATANKELQQQLQAAEKAAAEAAKEIEKIANNASELEMDQQLSKMLQEIAADAAKAAESLKGMSEQQSGERPLSQQEKDQLNSMQEIVQSDRKDIQEEAIDSIETLNQLMKLQMDEERFESLAQEQRSLAERMDSLRAENAEDAATERRMAEMEAAQEELRQQLQDLSQSIRENADQLPNEPENQDLKQSAQDFANALEESQAEPFMRGAQRSLLDSKFEQAAEQATLAAEELEQLMDDGKQMGKETSENAGKQFKPGRSGFDPKQAMEQMKQKFGKGKSRSSQRGQSSGQGAGDSEGDANSQTGSNQRGSQSQRNPSPSSMGLYGSMPKPSQSKQGRSDRISQGAATKSAIAKQDQGQTATATATESDAAGQGIQSIPPQYRNRVSDYMQRILEKSK